MIVNIKLNTDDRDDVLEAFSAILEIARNKVRDKSITKNDTRHFWMLEDHDDPDWKD